MRRLRTLIPLGGDSRGIYQRRSRLYCAPAPARTFQSAFLAPVKPFSAADGPRTSTRPTKSFSSSSKQHFPTNRLHQPCKAQHRPGQPAARAAAREALQDETRLERRFGADEPLLETRAAVIGGVRVRTPLDPMGPCLASPHQAAVLGQTHSSPSTEHCSRRITTLADPSLPCCRRRDLSVARQLPMRRR